MVVDAMATTLITVAVVISALLTINAVMNHFAIIRPRAAQIGSQVAILIPARNEENSITSAVQSALNQEMLENFEVVVLNDASTDATAEKLLAFSDHKLKVITGELELPQGWLGKNWACHRLSKSVDADFLVFIDSDVALEPLAVAAAINSLTENQLHLVSPYPRQLAPTLLARIVQPLLQWSWLATVPLRRTKQSLRPSLAVANGQFLVCRADSYSVSGGHEGIKSEVLDDIELLRSFYRNGFTGCVIDGSAIATCQMYESNQDLISGYSKSLWNAFGGPIGSLFVNAFFLFIYVFPLVGFFVDEVLLAALGIALGAAGRLISAKTSRSRMLPDALFHSISIVAFSVLNIVSWWRHLTGTNTWKSRDLK
jgi:glycosyltransferase involved in cell wall biosynthesis